MTSLRPSEIDKPSKSMVLLEKLLPHLIEAGSAHWLAKKENGGYKLKEEKEFEFYEEIQIFENLSFWSNLANRLAERDVEEAAGDEYYSTETFASELQAEMDIEDKYNEEFENNGLTNLRLIHPELN